MSGGLQVAAAATAAVYVGDVRVGSAVLIDGRHLLTAAHVLRRTVEGRSVLVDQAEVRFPTGPDPDAPAPVTRVPLPADVTADVAVLDLGDAPDIELPKHVSLWAAAGHRSAANALPDPVPEDVKQERFERIMGLSSQISTDKLAAKVGSTIEVLIDAVDPESGGATGRSTADAPEIDGEVHLRDAGGLTPGDFVRILVEDSDAHDLFGVPVGH